MATTELESRIPAEYDSIINELLEVNDEKEGLVFVTNELHCMRFSIEPTSNIAEEKTLKNFSRIIENYGGDLKFAVRDEGMHTIRLVHKEIKNSDSKFDLFLSKYVLDSIVEEKLLDLRNYRATKTKFPMLNPNDILQRIKSWEEALKEQEKLEEISDFSDEDEYSAMPVKKKICFQASGPRNRSYTVEEERAILKYIIDHKYYHKVKGNLIWQHMADDDVFTRSWQSLKQRYLHHIIPNIKQFKLDPRDEQKILLIHASRERSMESKNANSCKYPWFESQEEEPQTIENDFEIKEELIKDYMDIKEELVGNHLLTSNGVFDQSINTFNQSSQDINYYSDDPDIECIVIKKNGSIPTEISIENDLIKKDTSVAERHNNKNDASFKTLENQYQRKYNSILQKNEHINQDDDKVLSTKESSSNNIEASNQNAYCDNSESIYSSTEKVDSLLNHNQTSTVSNDTSLMNKKAYDMKENSADKENFRGVMESQAFEISSEPTINEDCILNPTENKIDVNENSLCDSDQSGKTEIFEVSEYTKSMSDKQDIEENLKKSNLHVENVEESELESVDIPLITNKKANSRIIYDSDSEEKKIYDELKKKSFPKVRLERLNLDLHCMRKGNRKKDVKENNENSSSSSTISSSEIDSNSTNKVKQRKKRFKRNCFRKISYSSASDSESITRNTFYSRVKERIKNPKEKQFDSNVNSKRLRSIKHEDDKGGLSESSVQSLPKSKKYTQKDDITILHYIYTKGLFDMVRGRSIWEDMEKRGILPGRSWHSLKERFRMRIFPRIQSYEKLDKKVVQTFLKKVPNGNYEGDISKKKRINIKYSEDEDECIIKFILNSKRYKEIKGKSLWVDMSKSKSPNIRTWESLKNRFLTCIVNNLDNFELTPKQRNNLEQVLKENEDLSKSTKHKKYSKEEDYSILEFIILNNRFKEIKGKSLWVAMSRNEDLKRRSWESLKNRFINIIAPSLNKYEIDSSARINFKDALKVKNIRRFNRPPPFKRESAGNQDSEIEEIGSSSSEDEPSYRINKISRVIFNINSSSDDDSNSESNNSNSPLEVHPAKTVLRETEKLNQNPSCSNTKPLNLKRKLHNVQSNLDSLYEKTPATNITKSVRFHKKCSKNNDKPNSANSVIEIHESKGAESVGNTESLLNKERNITSPINENDESHDDPIPNTSIPKEVQSIIDSFSTLEENISSEAILSNTENEMECSSETALLPQSSAIKNKEQTLTKLTNYPEEKLTESSWEENLVVENDTTRKDEIYSEEITSTTQLTENQSDSSPQKNYGIQKKCYLKNGSPKTPPKVACLSDSEIHKPKETPCLRSSFSSLKKDNKSSTNLSTRLRSRKIRSKLKY